MMIKQYKILIFDWDGTLADSVAQIVASAQYAARQTGLPEPDDEAVRRVIGLDLAQALHQAVPKARKADLPQLLQYYRRHYLSPGNRTVLFADTVRVLSLLRQHYWLAIATGKSRRGLTKGLRDTGIADYFLATRTVDECAAKPNPEMVLSICEELGTEPREVLMIGDTTHDLWLAANAGADAAAVSTGAHGADMLRQAPHVGLFAHLGDLAQWLGVPLS
ncbi:HAD-IA family hydrolase [Stenoxybacter acetivorans]|uniref:HAD-IA family hydrolase n=1 Tax=Stenoxybacter acetivorans TaxID=422441 RepID=UPI001FE11C5F|nr:HAD-IA family hydrolase [Stenoxybacter acetivorans]